MWIAYSNNEDAVLKKCNLLRLGGRLTHPRDLRRRLSEEASQAVGQVGLIKVARFVSRIEDGHAAL